MPRSARSGEQKWWADAGFQGDGGSMPIRAIGPAAAGISSGLALSASIELQQAKDLLEARVAMERPETGVLGDEAEVSGPRLDAVLEGVEGASRLADRHPLLGGALPAVGARR